MNDAGGRKGGGGGKACRRALIPLWVPLYYLIACELPGSLDDFLVDWWVIRNKSLCSGGVKACDYNALESLLCANLSRW